MGSISQFFNTGMTAPQDIFSIGSELLLDDQENLTVESRAVVILVSKTYPSDV